MNRENRDLHEQPIGNSLWRAGAGAGKTYNLVKRVMRIAEDWTKNHDGAFPRLVVTTFTRMATQELRVRLMESALQSASEGSTELIPFVTSRSQLFVTTLHGVMDSFLRSFGSEIGLEPGFRVGGADEIDSLVRRVGKRILFPAVVESATRSAAVDELMNEFDFSTALRLLQRVARIRIEFENSEKPARPATAEDLRASMALLLHNASRTLADLREEIVLHAPDPKWTPFIEWLGLLIAGARSATASDLRVEHLTELIAEEPTITNGGKIKIDFGAGGKWKDPVKGFEKTVADLTSEIPALAKFAQVNAALANVEEEFSTALRVEKFRAGLIELEDLELLALELIHKSPKSAESYAAGWDHWLIDEYQDTSPRQVLLIAALAKGRPQFVVGDPQQSIYLFRGARPNVFLDREELANAETHEKTELLGNRRSHPMVMKFVNHAVSDLGAEFQKMTSVRADQENLGVRAASRPSPLGPVTFLAMEPATSTDDDGGIKKMKADDLRRFEAEQITSAVTKILNAGASPASIAVLSRSNKDLAIVAREFGRRGLPFQVHTAGAFSDRLEVSDLCALLGFLSNPHDDENLIHLARTAWFPIDESILVKGYHRPTSLWQVLEKEQSLHRDLHEIETLQAGLIAARERGLVQAFREMLMSCDFFSWCGVLDPSGRREANALKFISKLSVAERQAGFVPRRFNDEILGGGDRGGESESNDRDAVAAAKPDRIHLMTIHVSKGLEFDHVFLPFLADPAGRGRTTNEFVLHEQKRLWSVGLSVADDGSSAAGPLAREWNDILAGWGVEEQKRLLYVAMTRARESLFLSATGEAKPKSFLSYFHLSRESGVHPSYTTVGSVDVPVEKFGSELGLAELRVPWGSVERKRNEKVFASVSVSRLLELEDEQASIMKPSERATPQASKRSLAMATAAARGTRLHRVFEMAKPDAARDEAESSEMMGREIARWFVEAEQEGARKALRWLLKLREPNLSSILVSGEVEWSFTYVRGEFAVDGQIDLWGRDPQGRLWVLDYKTGDSAYKDKALRQLKYYAEAIVASGLASADEEILLCALYPFSEEVFTEKWVPRSGRL